MTLRAAKDLSAVGHQTARARLTTALMSGEAFTRVEACERFGITGATFRWIIKSLRDAGAPLAFEVVKGGRGSVAKRWRWAELQRSSEAYRRSQDPLSPPNG